MRRLLVVFVALRPELVMKSIVPVVMAGVLGIYGLIIAVIISTEINPKAKSYYLFDGYAHLSSGLACGLAGLSAGMAIGIVRDSGVRANAQQPKLFVGMILILIFAEATCNPLLQCHLFKEFDKKFIIAFKDNEIERSLSLDPELKQAIKDSRIAVVIFSQHYASSSWCLNELLEIVECRKECGQMVIPVLYRLDPSHVRKQTGGDIIFLIVRGNEAAMIELDAEEVRMVGLWGSSGIGKTTIARVLFQRISQHFRGSIFIDRAFVSQTMEIFNAANRDDYNMKLHLQRNFLSEILGKGDIKINHLNAVGERLKNQKVLIFIDDFDDQVVLDALVGQTQWFGSGSRIIVVTNDKHFLRAHGIEHVYEVCLPSEDVAVEMLCQSAFRKNAAPEGFKELVVKVARLAGRLPLGLNVLGSS
ncbi:BnaC02g47230D [Brassica napus]|uniref:V-type proton ATPase proteolipid subunit n=4 Tax=Brassica TaxID=3705 RepID=A0A078IXT8_BRANA|nr:BnaC02g47230D [Brassica napus]VDD25357.1 unnamed protein product [Brassica oleracea]